MTVYVVTEGSYSDYTVMAIFSSEEKAIEYMGGHPEKFNDIETFELDVEPPRVFGQVWCVSLNLDGSVQQPLWSNELTDVPKEHRQGERGEGRIYPPINKYRGRVTGTSYVSGEHAMKLAVEQRQKALREHPEWFSKDDP